MPVSTKTVVVTGGTQGLGFGYAAEFLRRGWNVVICGRTQAGVDAAVAKLAAQAPAGVRAAGIACDTSDMAQVQALWDFAARELGRIDMWVNNAGYARSGPTFAQTKPEEIEAMVRSNVIGTMNACQVACAGMQRQGGGRIWITLGGGGATGRHVRGMTVYSSTKRALKYFADSMAKELKRSAVLVGTVSPGVNITEGMLREIAELAPADRGRMLKPLNFVADHVDTTAPWLVERMIGDTRQGAAIAWLTTGRLTARALGMMTGRRDVLSRYGLNV